MSRFRDLTSKLGVMGELVVFLWTRRMWWLIPMVVVLLVIGVFLVVAQGSALTPFIYTLF